MATLQAASEATLIHGLGQLASSRFTCGGQLQKPSTVQLVYVDKSGTWNGVVFPGLKDSDFQSPPGWLVLAKEKKQLLTRVFEMLTCWTQISALALSSCLIPLLWKKSEHYTGP